MAKEAPASEKDRRHCVLCFQFGDGETNGTARYATSSGMIQGFT
jgi:hypothetical protein